MKSTDIRNQQELSDEVRKEKVSKKKHPQVRKDRTVGMLIL